MADKSSFGIPGNGIEKNFRDRRHGADPPKNESGRTGKYDELLIQIQIDELREWGLHCCPKVFNFPSCTRIEEDTELTYAIAVLELSNHIIHGATIGLNEER